MSIRRASTSRTRARSTEPTLPRRRRTLELPGQHVRWDFGRSVPPTGVHGPKSPRGRPDQRRVRSCDEDTIRHRSARGLLPAERRAAAAGPGRLTAGDTTLTADRPALTCGRGHRHRAQSAGRPARAGLPTWTITGTTSYSVSAARPRTRRAWSFPRARPPGKPRRTSGHVCWR